jgi:carbonic anhydrase
VAIGDIHVVRNAGGRAVDALRSVTISQQLLGTTEVGGGAGRGCW